MKLAAAMLGFCLIGIRLAAVPTAPLIYGGTAEVRETVVPTGNFSEIGEASGKRSGVLQGLAVKLDQKRLFRWKPSPAAGPMGGADMMDAALSPDGTVLCIAERIGGAGKLNSTRLVLISPDSGLLGAQMMEEVRVLRLGFLPEPEGMLWMLAESGREAGSAPFLLIYDLLQGREAARAQELPAVPGDVLTAGGSLWIASAKDGTLFRYAKAELPEAPERISCGITAPALTERSGDVLAFRAGECAVFSVRNGRTVRTGTIPVPADVRPEWIRPMPGGNAGFAMVSADGRGGVLNGGAFSVLLESGASPGWIFPEGGKLIFGDRRLEALSPFSLPGLEPEKAVKPGKERPATRNRTFRTFALAGKVPTLLQLDERGNVFLIQLERRRVRKTPVLIVDRTGFR